jgi:hypothetical protein
MFCSNLMGRVRPKRGILAKPKPRLREDIPIPFYSREGYEQFYHRRTPVPFISRSKSLSLLVLPEQSREKSRPLPAKARAEPEEAGRLEYNRQFLERYF